MKIPYVTLILLLAGSMCSAQYVNREGPGKVIVRVQDPYTSHCIDASTEQVTFLLKRVWTEKKEGIFTEDNKAGAVVRTDLDSGDNKAHIPSVSLASIADDQSGHVSLALEYPVMRRFVLKQGQNLTTNVSVEMYLAKKRGRNTFGEIIDVAGKALAMLPVPANPYTTVAQQFLTFANNAIDKAVADDIENKIAQINLNFADRKVADLDRCHSGGYEFTGAIAVLLSTGKENTALIPIEDADKKYCFSYSSASVFGLTAVAKPASGRCPKEQAAYSEVPNDYVLFVLNATTTPATARGSERDSQYYQRLVKESRDRCSFYGISRTDCD